MKQLRTLSITSLLLTTLLLALTACGSGEPAPAETDNSEPPVVDSTTLPDTQTMAQAFLDGEVFSETLEELDLDTAYWLYAMEDYSVAREDITAGTVYLSAGATAEEVAVLTLADANIAHAALEALEAHIEAQQESYADYIPDEVTKLETASVTIYGDTVILVVPANADNAAAVVIGLLPF